MDTEDIEQLAKESIDPRCRVLIRKFPADRAAAMTAHQQANAIVLAAEAALADISRKYIGPKAIDLHVAVEAARETVIKAKAEREEARRWAHVREWNIGICRALPTGADFWHLLHSADSPEELVEKMAVPA